MEPSPKIFAATLAVFLLALLNTSFSIAQQASSTSTDIGEYTIHHTVFNSSFLSPDIAAIYGLTRGKDKAIANIALTQKTAEGDSLGMATDVSGEARNLMQQSTRLEFNEVREQNATYYIAPFEFDDKEIMHFYIDVLIPGETRSRQIKFTKKLYQD